MRKKKKPLRSSRHAETQQLMRAALGPRERSIIRNVEAGRQTGECDSSRRAWELWPCQSSLLLHVYVKIMSLHAITVLPKTAGQRLVLAVALHLEAVEDSSCEHATAPRPCSDYCCHRR